jgi:hypothetical protein
VFVRKQQVKQIKVQYMKKIKFNYFLILPLVLGLLNVNSALANVVPITDPLGLGDNAVNELAARLVQAALGLSGVLALLAFIYGGIMYLLAGVNPEFVKKGKETMKWAVIGLLVIFSSYAIINFILTQVFKVT